MVRGREDLVDGARPPRGHELVLVGEEVLVPRCTAHDDGLCPEERGFEGVGGELGHPLLYELLRFALPPSRQVLNALSDERQARVARREVAGGFRLGFEEYCE